MSGTFDREIDAWVFPDFMSDEVDELDFIYNSEMQVIEVEFLDDAIGNLSTPVELFGYSIARTYDRDDIPQIFDGIAVLSGNITSGGSRKNYLVKIHKGTKLRMMMPMEVLKRGERDDVVVTVIDKSAD